MALIFLEVLIVFTVSEFRISPSHIAVTSSPMMIDPNSPDFSPLDYHGWGGNAEVLSQAATKAKNSSRVQDTLQLVWSALPEKAIDNAVKDYRKRLQTCVGQR